MHTDWSSGLRNLIRSEIWSCACTMCMLPNNRLKNLIRNEIWSHACVFCPTLLLPSTAKHAGWNSKRRCHQQKKQKTPACIMEIQIQKLGTKVYSQKGLTAMYIHCMLWHIGINWAASCAPHDQFQIQKNCMKWVGRDGCTDHRLQKYHHGHHADGWLLSAKLCAGLR